MYSWLYIKYKRWKNAYPKKVPATSRISRSVTFVVPENIFIGDWVFVGPETFIECKGGVDIQDGAILSSKVTILSSSHNYAECQESVPYGEADIKARVTLKKACWIGYGALILPGVTIGECAIVGAGAVVSRDVPDGAISVGNPAKVVKYRPDSGWRDLIEKKVYRLAQK